MRISDWSSDVCSSDLGAIFVMSTGPNYANIDYTNAFMDKIVKEVFPTIPESDVSFSITGIDGLNSGIAGLKLTAWEDRDRSIPEIQPELQQKLDGIAGVQSFAFAISTLPGSGGGLPVQFVIRSPGPPETVAQVADAIADEARRSGRFIMVDTTLKYDTPELSVEIDRDKAAALGITMEIGRAHV